MKRGKWLPFRHLKGTRAAIGGSAAALVEQYLEQDNAVKKASNLPVSQRYYYASRNQVERTELSPRHKAIQLRLGDARLLISPERGHTHLNNSNEAHPLYFAETSPRQSGLCHSLIHALHQLSIHKLTPLQGALIPLILKGKHVIAHSETGTGKSFGIALAVANRLLRDQINYRLHTLIIAPTEELSLQYEKWLRHFAGESAQVVQAAIERIPLELQLARLHNIHPHVLVGTPQRIAALHQCAPAFLNPNDKLRRRVDCLILDEADKIISTPLHVRSPHSHPARQHHHAGSGSDGQGRQGRGPRREEKALGLSMTGRGSPSIPDGAALVDRLFRHHPDEVPAQLVAASATIDSQTARLLNTWTRNDKAVRLTSSFSEHSIPTQIQFYFFSSTPRYSLRDCVSLIIQLIVSDHRMLDKLDEETEKERSSGMMPPPPKRAPPRVLLITSDEEDVQQTVDFLCCAEMQKKIWKAGDGKYDSWSCGLAVPVQATVKGATPSPRKHMAKGRGDEAGEGHHRSSFRLSSAVGVHPPPLYPTSPRIIPQRGDVFVQNNTGLSLWTQGKSLVGVCSAEGCRGLHVNDVTHVILYGNCPTANTFLHCAGRTGRMGKDGKVIVLFPPSSGRRVQEVCSSVEVPFHAGKMEEVEKLLEMR